MGNQSIEVLNLEYCGMVGSEGPAAIGRLVRTNTTLQELTLSDNSLRDDGAISLVDNLMGNHHLRVLNLNYCAIRANGAAALGRLLEANATIEELDISNNIFEDTGCIALADCLTRSQGLRVLNLRGCRVLRSGVGKRIGRALTTNIHLEMLDLRFNNITEEDFTALAEGLSCNTTLLQLPRNRRYDRGGTMEVPSSIDDYLAANRVLHRFRSREPATFSPFLLSIILARVSCHPAVLYLFVRDHIPDLIASSADGM
jgi:Leucine-rich repeat (LRR) protein